MRLFVLLLLAISMFSTQAYCLDINLEEVTIWGKPFDINPKFIVAKMGKPKPNEPAWVFEYPMKGINVNFDEDNVLQKISVYFLAPGTGPVRYAPNNYVPFKGEISFGIRKGAKFNDVLTKVRKSGKPYVAYSGVWCFAYNSCEEPGNLIVFAINNDWSARVSFSDNIVNNIDINRMRSYSDYLADTSLDKSGYKLPMRLEAIERRD